MAGIQKPGETPNKPGTYEEVGPRGGAVTDPRRIRVGSEDNHLPPTPEPNHRWKPIPQQKPPKK